MSSAMNTKNEDWGYETGPYVCMWHIIIYRHVK